MDRLFTPNHAVVLQDLQPCQSHTHVNSPGGKGCANPAHHALCIRVGLVCKISRTFSGVQEALILCGAGDGDVPVTGANFQVGAVEASTASSNAVGSRVVVLVVVVVRASTAGHVGPVNRGAWGVSTRGQGAG